MGYWLIFIYMNISILCGLAAAALWGTSNVLAKGLLAHFEPMSFLLIESIGSCVLLWALLIFQKKHISVNRGIIKYSLLGLVQPGLAYIFAIYGLSLTTANNDSLVWASETIVIIFLAWLVFRERIGWTIVLLAIGGTIGTILATSPNADAGHAPSVVLGNLLVLVGVFCAAIYSVGTQHQLIKIEPWLLMTLHQTSSLILLVCVWFLCLPFLHPFNRGTTQLDCFLGIICGLAQFAVPFWLYLKSIKGLGVARASIFLVLPPIFTIIASFFFLGERLSPVQWLGALLALGAVTGLCLLRPEETPGSVLLVE